MTSLISACGESAKAVTQTCTQESTTVGAVFAMQQGEPKPTGDVGTLVVVDVVDYHYTGARIAFGVTMGNAYINAKVTFRVLGRGDVRGRQAYDTKSSAWQGIFAGMTTKQVHAMCHEIVGRVAP